MLKKLLIVFIISLLCNVSVAQSIKINKLADKAETHMEDEDFDKAYDYFDQLTKLDSKNPYWKFQKARCALRMPDKKEEAITLFTEVKQESPNDNIVLYYLGRAYHHNYKFTEAIEYFDAFLATEPEDKDLVDEAIHFKENSIFGENLTKTMVDADIQNVGPPINTDQNEYVPVISTDESVIIYTYKGVKSKGGLQNANFKPDKDGAYYEDIMISHKASDSTWGEPQSIGDNINTVHNDASIALSPDGQELYTYYSDVKNGGDIYVCHLDGEEWGKPEPLGPNINTPEWEGSCSVTADGQYLYFASERPGGYGKRDLYVSKKQEDGVWGPAENLGPTINTKYNDDDPFIHPDGITLFFSSQGHKSIGGYDIMYSIKKDGKWIDPINMGFPLNTTDDDRFYVITARGDRGYFSSNRKSIGGGGNQDIYTVTPGIIGEKPILAMVIGVVYGNDIPMEAKLEVVKKSTGEVIGPFNSNSKTGKYLVALSPGENYTFKVKADGFEEHQEDLDIANLSKFVEIRKDFHLSKDGYKDPHQDTVKKLNDYISALLDTITDASQFNIIDPDNPYEITPVTTNTVTPVTTNTTTTNGSKENPCAKFKVLDFTALKNKSLNDPKVYAKLLAIAEIIDCGDFEYRVQIAAYRHPENYKWDHLKTFGQPDIKDYPDGITRFTQGTFKDLLEAEAQRQKAIAKGQTDAWIVAFKDGKRYTLEELIMVDFFNNNMSRFYHNLDAIEEYLVVNYN